MSPAPTSDVDVEAVQLEFQMKSSEKLPEILFCLQPPVS